VKRLRIVSRQGEMQFVYDDALAGLAAGGEVMRASHVEPASSYCGGCSRPYEGGHACRCGEPKRPVASFGWVADMAPVGGGLLGTYLTREAALAAERDWLRKEWGL
jgi:hypothetical protein